jgi:hypothetical protein
VIFIVFSVNPGAHADGVGVGLGVLVGPGVGGGEHTPLDPIDEHDELLPAGHPACQEKPLIPHVPQLSQEGLVTVVGVGVGVLVGVGVGPVGVGVIVEVGVGVLVGPSTKTSVSVAPVVSHTLSSLRSAVAHTAVLPPATPVTVVKYTDPVESIVGDTVAIEVLYDPNLILVIVADPNPEDTLAVTVPPPPIPIFNTDGVVVPLQDETGVGVGEGIHPIQIVGVGVDADCIQHTCDPEQERDDGVNPRLQG